MASSLSPSIIFQVPFEVLGFAYKALNALGPIFTLLFGCVLFLKHYSLKYWTQ